MRLVYLAYLTVVGSALGWLLHRDPDTYRYIPASLRTYPGGAGVAAMLKSARVHPGRAPSGARRSDGDSPCTESIEPMHDRHLEWSGEGAFTQR